MSKVYSGGSRALFTFLGRFSVVCFCCSIPLLSSPTLLAQMRNEYTVKAGFILNFAQLIEFPVAHTGVPICILAGSEVMPSFEALAKAQTSNTKLKISLHDLRSGNPGSCDIVFIARGMRAQAATLSQFMTGKGILTIGDDDNFTENGGVIRFFELDGRIQFEINTTAVTREGLKVSSRLMRLAKLVEY